MFRKEFLLRVLYEYKSIFIYAGLFILGLFLMWYVRGLFPSSQNQNAEPTPLEQYR